MGLFDIFAKTKLKKEFNSKTGKVSRVHILRRGLKAKLWIQKAERRFDIHYKGQRDEFSVLRHTGEPPHFCEAREALHDVGLDINSCSWDDIVAKAK